MLHNLSMITRSAKLRAALAVSAAFGMAHAAHANMPVLQTQNIFHQAVCDSAIGPGKARCHAHVITDSRGNRVVTTNAAKPAAVVPSGYGATDLRQAYNITTTGTSRIVIAVIDAYGYPNAEDDMNAYRKQYGLPGCTSASGCFKKVNQNGGTILPAYNASWAVETALDLDMVSAMCPYCTITLVQASDNNLANLGAAVHYATTHGASIVTNSYGGGEQGTDGLAQAYFVTTSSTIVASAGDSGYGPQFPASYPNVVAVGGTALNRTTSVRGWSETAWSGSGSGCSTVFSKPSWQKDTLCTKRTQNDIAAVASPSTPVAVYGPVGSATSNLASGWMMLGGTSVSAPLIAGMMGSAGANPHNPSTIYSASAKLNDVVSGSTGSCKGTYLCTSQAGYDGPTGQGTPNGTSAF